MVVVSRPVWSGWSALFRRYFKHFNQEDSAKDVQLHHAQAGAVVRMSADVLQDHNTGFSFYEVHLERNQNDLANLNCPVFTGELLVQILSCFFIGIQGFIEVLLCFMWRDVTDFAV
jgi:hypothetical protein